MSESGHRESPAGDLEIRILEGVHAGAVVSIGAGQTVSLGSADTNDLILRDAPFSSARLAASAAGWSWIEDDPTIGQQEFALGRGLRAAGLSLAVSSAGSPWPAWRAGTIDYQRPNSAGRSDAGAEAMAGGAPNGVAPGSGWSSAAPKVDPSSSDVNGSAAPQPAVVGEPVTETAIGTVRDRSERLAPGKLAGERPVNWRHAAWLAPGAVMVGLAWFAGHSLYHSVGRESEPPQVATESSSATPVASPEDLSRIDALLAAAGFNDVVKARLRADGRIDVLGVLDSVEEQDQVLRLLAPERRLLSLRLLNQREFVERVREAGRSLPPGFQVSALPGGGVLLTGLAIGGTEAEAARRALSEALPELMALTVRVSQPADVAALLAAQLHEKGLGEIAVNWSGSHIVVDGRIPRSAEGTLEATLLGFNARFGDRLMTRADLALLDLAAPVAPLADTAAMLPPPKLPKIVAIQSGSLSYLLFADGSRVLPGGMVNGYRLAAIDDDALLFEDRDGNQHRIPR